MKTVFIADMKIIDQLPNCVVGLEEKKFKVLLIKTIYH